MKQSLINAVNSIKQFAKRAGQVPTGFKKLFFETKDVFTLSLKKQSQNLKRLRRKEEELIRSNFSAIQKLTIYFFLQLPPIIGVIPVS